MYYYIREFCDPYFQSMPVQYEKQDDGQFHKVGMACTNSGKCGVSLSECKHFVAATETLEKEVLYENKI